MVKLTVRVSDEQLLAWKEAAWSRKVTLSEWVRRTLDANAAQTQKENKK